MGDKGRRRRSIESLTPAALAYCAIVLVLSYGLRGTAGFGSVVAMPLLALVVPMKILVPAWTLMGIASSLTVLGRDRAHIVVKDLGRILPACILGIGLGLYVFATLDTETLARGLGVTIIFYGAYSLWSGGKADPAQPRSPRIVGPLSGILGGITGATFGTMASLFFAVYLDTLRVTKVQFRATMSALLLTLGTVRGLGYYAVGEFSLEALILFAAGLPLMLLGMFLGDRIHARISEAVFRRLVSAILIVSGVALLIR
jgi:uncharacterized protein